VCTSNRPPPHPISPCRKCSVWSFFFRPRVENLAPRQGLLHLVPPSSQGPSGKSHVREPYSSSLPPRRCGIVPQNLCRTRFFERSRYIILGVARDLFRDMTMFFLLFKVLGLLSFPTFVPPVPPLWLKAAALQGLSLMYVPKRPLLPARKDGFAVKSPFLRGPFYEGKEEGPLLSRQMIPVPPSLPSSYLLFSTFTRPLCWIFSLRFLPLLTSGKAK